MTKFQRTYFLNGPYIIHTEVSYQCGWKINGWDEMDQNAVFAIYVTIDLTKPD